MGNLMQITGDIDATTTWYFAIKKSIFIKASTEENANMTMGIGAMGEIPMVSETNSEIDLVL